MTTSRVMIPTGEQKIIVILIGQGKKRTCIHEDFQQSAFHA